MDILRSIIDKTIEKLRNIALNKKTMGNKKLKYWVMKFNYLDL